MENVEKEVAPYDRAAALAHHLFDGSADYLEAGDCRQPGLIGALRAVATGDPKLPLAVAPAERYIKLEDMEKLTLEAGLDLLRAKAAELGATLGPAARVFTVKLRKNYNNV